MNVKVKDIVMVGGKELIIKHGEKIHIYNQEITLFPKVRNI